MKVLVHVDVKHIFSAFLFLLFLIFVPGFSIADNSGDQNQMRSYLAEKMRIDSSNRAAANIGYERIYQEKTDKTVDYRVLSEQIDKIGQMIKQMDRCLLDTKRASRGKLRQQYRSHT